MESKQEAIKLVVGIVVVLLALAISAFAIVKWVVPAATKVVLNLGV